MVKFYGPRAKKVKAVNIAKKCEECNNWFCSAVDKAKCSLCTKVFESAMERIGRLEHDKKNQYTDWY